MNKTIEEAAKDYAYDIGDSDWERMRLQDAFIDGINHIMQLPLCDRLTAKERETYRKDNDMNEFDKRAEAYMRTVMNNDGDVFTRADLYEYIMDAWKAGYAEAGFDLSLLSGESLSKAQNQKSQPIN